MHTHSPRLRLCERCWRPIAPSVVARIRWYRDLPGEAWCSFRHVDDDPMCTGAQDDGTLIAVEADPALPPPPISDPRFAREHPGADWTEVGEERDA